MKKIITVLVAVAVVSAILFGITFAIKKYKENNALATAETVYEVSDNKGSVTVNEGVARQMLGQYPLDVLGIEKPLDEYIMKLGETSVFNNRACKVELYLTEDAEIPEAIFAISGYECFVFDATKNEYLLLTLNGAFSVETKETTTEPEETLFYDEENNAKLHKVIDKYSAKDLGFGKNPSEYIIVVLGSTVKASDGKMVYPVKMYEKDGTPTNYTCAIDGETVYKFDATEKMYVKA